MDELNGFSDEARVWIYQSNKAFDNKTAASVRSSIKAFASQWVSHNRALKSFGDLLYDRFVILVVDETAAGASGCSIDASVHYLKSLQTELGVDLFNRMQFSYLVQGEVKTVDRSTFSRLYKDGSITDQTMVVDTLIKTKAELPNLLKPLSDSWHQRMV